VIRRLLFWLESSLTGYLVLWFGVILTFAVMYFYLSFVPGQGSDQIAAVSDPLERFLTALYFSAITGSTVGYGDVLPLGISRGLAALEGVLSFILLAVFVSRIASRKQDAAISDIHLLARDSLFNSFRHGLFIARKDLDIIVQKVESGAVLVERDWKNVRTAFRLMHTQIDNIPQLYATNKKGEQIDEDHEQLVLDSVERSLRRAREVMTILEERGISCKSDQKCMSELNALVQQSHKSFVTIFATAYNSENDEAFQEMIRRLDELKEHI
jgi:hypothetical protein